MTEYNIYCFTTSCDVTMETFFSNYLELKVILIQIQIAKLNKVIEPWNLVHSTCK